MSSKTASTPSNQDPSSFTASDSADPASAPVELPNAGPISRLAALGYDCFLLFGLLFVPLFILTAIRAPRSNLETGGVVHELPLIAPHYVMLPYTILMITAFYVYFWRRNGQTLGMQAWRLRLDSRDGGRASLRQCLIRMPIGFLSLLLGGLGYWWIWFDRDRLAWQDRVSNTRVVVLPKRKKESAAKAATKPKPEPEPEPMAPGSGAKKAGKARATAPKSRRRKS